jgi:D-sedoheptulose 7-phosphate isomerase
MSMFSDYSNRLQGILSETDWAPVEALAEELLACWRENRQVFICGNGGSAGNAGHIANDLLYGVSMTYGSGIRAHALSDNTAVLTCLANDVGYDSIFANQLAVQAQQGDILIVLSGSGNSTNIVKALETAQDKAVKSFAIVGFSGGKAKELADVPIHFPIDDMQISEDLQLIACHMISRWLYDHRAEV